MFSTVRFKISFASGTLQVFFALDDFGSYILTRVRQRNYSKEDIQKVKGCLFEMKHPT